MSQKLLDAILEKKDLEAVAAVEKMLAEGYDPIKYWQPASKPWRSGNGSRRKNFFLPDQL